MRIHHSPSILFILLSIMLIMAGCAPAFSKQALDKVDRGIAFRELQNNPERFQGKWTLLGGAIVETRNTPEGTVIEVLQTPLDRQGRPRDTDATEGRFIIMSPEFLDSAVYARGKRISVVGEVSGRKMQPLGETQYRYPVVAPKEIRLWEPRSSPQFSFGVGIGVFHRF